MFQDMLLKDRWILNDKENLVSIISDALDMLQIKKKRLLPNGS